MLAGLSSVSLSYVLLKLLNHIRSIRVLDPPTTAMVACGNINGGCLIPEAFSDLRILSTSYHIWQTISNRTTA